MACATVLGEEGWSVSGIDAAKDEKADAFWIFCARSLEVEPPKESFGGSRSLPRTGISEGPTTAQPQERASTPDIRKLS